MNILDYCWIIIQILIGATLLNPAILFFASLFRKKTRFPIVNGSELDHAIIVTAYEQIDLLPSVVNSILKLDYNNYKIYVVADNCDISSLSFSDTRVVVLRPELTLASNIRSHFYAIDHFEREHDCLTIIDSDNLVDPDYLKQVDAFLRNNFQAVQGVRKAKNLETTYACLDEAGDMYYRFIDRKVTFDIGSSASLAGSGMTFKTSLYKECLATLMIDGAGFDKVLQMEILKKGYRIAFAEKAVVYDEKTSHPKQLVNQRARWLNSWFKYAGRGLELAYQGISHQNWNQFVCGIVFSKPPLFIAIILALFSIAIDIFIMPYMIVFWMVTFSGFLFIFLYSLSYFKASRVIYSALIKIPMFIYLQIISLFKAKNANRISTATLHHYKSDIDNIQKE